MPEARYLHSPDGMDANDLLRSGKLDGVLTALAPTCGED